MRAQLTARYPEIWCEEIEEAVQYACKNFLSEAKGIGDPGQVYAWIRTATLCYPNREANRRRPARAWEEDSTRLAADRRRHAPNQLPTRHDSA
ncbi:MAG: hypothetical protein ACLGG5_00535 [Thermoleophilia bacterium]